MPGLKTEICQVLTEWPPTWFLDSRNLSFLICVWDGNTLKGLAFEQCLTCGRRSVLVSCDRVGGGDWLEADFSLGHITEDLMDQAEEFGFSLEEPWET